MSKKTRLRIECALLYFFLPPMLYLIRYQVASRIFFVLAAAAAFCSLVLFKDPGFDRRILWRWDHFGRYAKSILCIFLPTSIVLSVISLVFLPDKFLAFPSTRPMLWLAVMLFYPLLMALPQEIVFRSFFFQRYRSLFANSRQMVLLNALSFSLAHLFYANWVAVVLSFCGGILFAWRYHVSQSLPLVSLEHALWGNYLFTIGIGWYFYSGSIT